VAGIAVELGVGAGVAVELEREMVGVRGNDVAPDLGDRPTERQLLRRDPGPG